MRGDVSISPSGDARTPPSTQASCDERSIPFDERRDQRLTCCLFGPDFIHRPARQIKPHLLAGMGAVIERPKIGLRAVSPPEIERGVQTIAGPRQHIGGEIIGLFLSCANGGAVLAKRCKHPPLHTLPVEPFGMPQDVVCHFMRNRHRDGIITSRKGRKGRGDMHGLAIRTRRQTLARNQFNIGGAGKVGVHGQCLLHTAPLNCQADRPILQSGRELRECRLDHLITGRRICSAARSLRTVHQKDMITHPHTCARGGAARHDNGDSRDIRQAKISPRFRPPFWRILPDILQEHPLQGRWKRADSKVRDRQPMGDGRNARVHIAQLGEFPCHGGNGQEQQAQKRKDQATHHPQIGLPLKSSNRAPHIPVMSDAIKWHGTTIVSVRKSGKVVIAGDGQVSMGQTVMKPNAKKVRPLGDGKVIAGFAGATADAFTLFERLERKLEQFNGQLLRAAVELAKDWRTDKYLRNLEAMMIVADKQVTLILTGNGDVLEPVDGIAAIGSGGNFALAAARALMDYEADAETLARKAMAVAAEICVYTNDQLTVETLESST